MSNFLAIATVTGALRRILQATVSNDVQQAEVTTIRPSSTALPNVGVNIYLYQVSPNGSWRNADLPTRTQSGSVVQRPKIGLDLHYLFTFYGDESVLEPQRILGSVVRTLHARPYLTRDTIHKTTIDPTFAFLINSDLAEEVELVKFTPTPLSLEELSKLWSVLFQTTYTLSITYTGMVVLIEADETPRQPLPVREQVIIVSPFHRPVVEKVISVKGEGEPIEMGDTILIQGSGLDGSIAKVRVGVAELQPVPDSVTPKELKVALTDVTLRAGIQGVQLVYTDGSESNITAIVLRPLITVDQANVTSSAVPISFNPPVSRTQRVTLFLNELNPPANRAPFAYSFDSPLDESIASPEVEERTEIIFEIANVEPGEYLVRVYVSGAENVLGMGLVGGVKQYNAPTVVIPL